ncbi:MAG: class I SAM-dependent rRNA methyltransferase [Clostridia bacterium]|nr:class I SAM-dependent rRNA methyltransferase [Clostridia bacterium]
MEYGRVCLRRGEAKDLRQGSVWIFDNEIDWVDDLCTDGSIVEVVDSRLKFVAYGYFNSKSKICVRVLSRDKHAVIDKEFFRERIERAWAYRKALGLENSCRVVFGESDGLPGLTVDKYGDYLCFQTVALGIERWKREIIEILVSVFAPKGIFERNDVAVREKEGMSQSSGCVYGEVPQETTIMEHDAKMLVNIPDGQKTGHFLDQQENRGRISPYVKDRSVLDLCCCTGGFSIHAALYGASSVEAVDVSSSALELVRKNAELNGVSDKIITSEANVFDLAKAYSDEGKQFGTVICDPPAFAKSKKSLDAAYRGYKELNLRCMKMVEPGGYLITCSCSQFMTPELFMQMLREAAADSGRTVRLIETLMQSRDHPASLGAEHALYLKGYILHLM